MELGWLIERGNFYIGVCESRIVWTPLVNKALRFSRKEDGLAFNDTLNSPGDRVVEHAWATDEDMERAREEARRDIQVKGT